jgi:hypothetical protein
MFTYRFALIWRWNLLLGLLFTIFWGVWDISGEIPVGLPINDWPFNDNPLPGLSRWWDIIIIPICISLFIYSFTSLCEKEEIQKPSIFDWISVTITFSAVVGLTMGLGFGLYAGFFGIIITFITVLAISLLIMFMDCVVDGTFKKWILAKDKEIK